MQLSGYLKIFNVIAIISIGGSLLHYHHAKTADMSKIHTEQVKTQQYNNSRKHYKVSSLLKYYEQHEPNLYKVLHNNRNQLQKGVKLAFGGCQTASAYHKHESQIESIFGSDVSDKLFDIVSPYSLKGDNPITSEYHGPHSISASVASDSISYGKFNTANQTIPVNIAVNFKTPKFSPNYQFNPSKKVHKYVIKHKKVPVYKNIVHKHGKHKKSFKRKLVGHKTKAYRKRITVRKYENPNKKVSKPGFVNISAILSTKTGKLQLNRLTHIVNLND